MNKEQESNIYVTYGPPTRLFFSLMITGIVEVLIGLGLYFYFR